MDISIQLIISIISSLAGMLSLSATLKSFLKFRNTQKSKLKISDELSFETAIQSDDIKILGSYLEDVIGNFTIRDYATNKKIETRVNKYIEKISSFVGRTEDVKDVPIERPKNLFENEPFWNKISVEYDDVLKELRFGEPWNALAKLRRHLEITIKKLFSKYNLQYKDIFSVTKQLHLLEREEIITKNDFENLKYSISVANKAIHGIDINEKEAEEAIYTSGIVLAELQKIINA